MARPRPPATLEALRALLDRASARRSFITGAVGALPEGGGRPVPSGTRCRTILVAVDRDYLATIIADGDRLDTRAVAAHLRAARAQVLGPRMVRAWLGTAGDLKEAQESTTPLAWNEVPLITQIPTLMDAALLERDFLLGGTGDPDCILRIAPRELRRVTEAGTATIAHHITINQRVPDTH